MPCSPVVLVTVALVAGSPSAPPPTLLYVQTDRPAYRLGETVWYRVHAPRVQKPVTVRLLGPRDEVLGETVHREEPSAKDDDPAIAGRFLLPLGNAGGVHRLEARAADGASHTTLLDVYDLAVPKADLRLTLLGDVFFPGSAVNATIQALDLKGRPIPGARVEHRATFGETTLRISGGVTDSEGRAWIRFDLPADVVESGHLAAGIILPSGGEAAVACRVSVSARVDRIEAFPEGGAVVAGHLQRFGLYVTGQDGNPTAAEGHVVDDHDHFVAEFKADELGLAQAQFTCAEGRSYFAVIDRPPGADRKFPLPGATGHRYSLAVDRIGKSWRVSVRGGASAAGRKVDVLLVRGDEVLKARSTRLRARARLADAAVEFADPTESGLGHVIVKDDGRVVLRRAIYLGEAKTAVTLKPTSKAALVPGSDVELEVFTTHDGRPVSADLALAIYQGGASTSPQLAERVAFESSGSSLVAPPRDVLQDPKRLDAYLLVHEAYAFPPSGIALEGEAVPKQAVGRVGPLSGHDSVRSKDHRASSSQIAGAAKSSGTTVVRSTGLERALERAHFTRRIGHEVVEPIFHVRRPPEALLDSPGLGRLSSAPPQLKVPSGSSFDCRPTLYWGHRVRTDANGRARIALRLNHVSSEIQWSAQGFAGIVPVSADGMLRPDQSFAARFDLPDHLHVGDRFDLMVTLTSAEGQEGLVEIETYVPACLKPLLPTRFTFNPRLDPSLRRLQFDVLAPTGNAELRLLAIRGAFEEVHVRKLHISPPSVELENGICGRDVGPQAFSMKVPLEAACDSVRVAASVAPDPVVEAFDEFPRLIRRPTGCFEQFTSSNFINLVILDGLKKDRGDPHVAEEAFRFATEGIQRLLSHRDESSGGFSTWPGGKAETLPTVIALRHLAIYSRVTGGLFKKDLEAAVAWLEKARLPPREMLLVTCSLAEDGRTWAKAGEVIRMEARGAYDRALQAAALAAWPVELPPPGKAKLEALLHALEEGFEPSRLDETGLLGSTGEYLTAEVLALGVVAFEKAGRPDDAIRWSTRLASHDLLSLGTQGLVLAIRAFQCVSPAASGDPLEVEFRAGSLGSRRVAAQPGDTRVLSFEKELALKPGDTATIAADIRSERPVRYQLRMSYATASPRSSPKAPFQLSTRLKGVANSGDDTILGVSIEPKAKTPSTQTVARIGIPAALEVKKMEMQELVKEGKLDYWEVRDGYLDLYWARTLEKGVDLAIPVKARWAGNFTARPSVVYPYYEPGKEWYAEPLAIRVHNLFGKDAKVPPPRSLVR